MSTDDESEIDPSELEAEALRAVKTLVGGFPEAHEDPSQFSAQGEYRWGKHDAYSAVLAQVSKWIEAAEEVEE